MPYMLPGFFCERVIRERGRRDGEGTVTQPLRFEGQDFVILKQSCLAQKCLFEDHVFPAGVQALGSHELSQKTKMKAITWKRPKKGWEEGLDAVPPVSVSLADERQTLLTITHPSTKGIRFRTLSREM
ncbi:Calpain-1 catalytic subunit [Myotis davidii]|uniref:Calpain-1 catalytic subunit n=1 Tax=Myotis davidii TaxID=225400 RepID=L5LS52_MYODS|nr:Calpain-1 catalytic subunit [Myotis davidii]